MVTGVVRFSFIWLSKVASVTISGCLLGVSSVSFPSREILVLQLILIGSSLVVTAFSWLRGGGNSFVWEKLGWFGAGFGGSSGGAGFGGAGFLDVGFMAAGGFGPVLISSSSFTELTGWKFFVTILGGTTLVISMPSSDSLSLLSSAHILPVP